MLLKPGLRLVSTACSTQVIVVRGSDADVDLRCGGYPLVPAGEEAETHEPDPAFAAGTLMGKRYGGDDVGIELLCTKPGTGTLAIGDTPVPLKEAKPLPSSD